MVRGIRSRSDFKRAVHKPSRWGIAAFAIITINWSCIGTAWSDPSPPRRAYDGRRSAWSDLRWEPQYLAALASWEESQPRADSYTSRGKEIGHGQLLVSVQTWNIYNLFLLVCVLQLEKPENPGNQSQEETPGRRQRHRQKVDLRRKGEDVTQKELESKKARSSRIKPKKKQVQEATHGENVFLTHPTEHTHILKEHMGSVQPEEISPTSSFPSLTPLLHLSYFHQQEL